MTELRKFSLKKYFFALAMFAFLCAITWKTKANSTYGSEIYSTLTRDARATDQKDTVPDKKNTASQRDSLPITDSTTRSAAIRQDTIPVTKRIDSFSLKLSKDTLDAPIDYEAEDSAVI